MTKKPDTEESIQAEIDAAQAERVTFEQSIRKQWTDGLKAIDVKIRNAMARLTVARAERTRAEAIAAAAAKPQEPVNDA